MKGMILKILIGLSCAALAVPLATNVQFSPASDLSYPKNQGYVGIVPDGLKVPWAHVVVGTLTVVGDQDTQLINSLRMKAWMLGADALTDLKVDRRKVEQSESGRKVRREKTFVRAVALHYQDRKVVDSLFLRKILRVRN